MKKPNTQPIELEPFISAQAVNNIKNKIRRFYRRKHIFKAILTLLVIGLIAYGITASVMLNHTRADLKKTSNSNSYLSSRVDSLNADINDLKDRLSTQTDNYTKLRAAVIAEALNRSYSLLNTELTKNCPTTSTSPLPAPVIGIPTPAEQALLDKQRACYDLTTSYYINNFILTNR